jgi:quercetin dioxygenase-like cupin family protein
MEETEVRVESWSGEGPVTEAAIRQLCEAEGLEPYRWSNAPGDVYSQHVHSYDKVIFVVRGSITFGLPERSWELDLQTGDRLDLPAGTVHDAVVGPEGVVCLEAHQT